ncbi:ABC transporter substrate-binding protein [Truepera radiovictrix]|uniref:Extracellular ligand-binding receptor n=1 Tax=Truepera radiovictrix (strain DSM 17093 / CIP 108686 / LMG 22925 / RQ-24) TaxID=649638 RepID=D7CSU0_TRURR|nr:ABC transporter substrate-binding protein [Truepera radiovictrix]ADI13707.1 Extracellular ligand-binding receptor [Truepera radiovictrix DSM 17093]WMT57728.1 ABC transporter substrate-binding protein [Truepera radiovictrix]
MKRLFLSLLTLFGVALAQTPGVSDTEIRIGSFGPQSGPAAAWGTVMTAIGALFDHVNAQGGIHGRNLVLITRDDGYDPARSVAAVRELIDRERVFALVGGVGTANGLAVMPIVKREGIPWVSPSSGSSEFAAQSDGLIFATYTNYEVESALMTRYAVQDLESERIAIFYQNDGYGEEGLRGLEREVAALQEAGHDVTIVDRVSYERGETNMAVQALRLRGGEADTVVMYSTPGAAASLIAEFGRLEYTPRILASSTLLDPSLLANPGMQGALVATFMRLPSVIVGEGNGDPIADEVFNTIVVPYAPEAAQDPFRALAGVGFAQPLIVALEAAGPDLTREALLEALRGISGYDEGLFPNLDFTEGYQGNNSVMLLQMTPEGLRPASDYLTY